MITIRQRSAWSGFEFEALDGAGTAVASLRWPTWAQARNARLRWHTEDPSAGDVKLLHLGTPYGVRYEYLKRAMINDTRYTLYGPAGDLAVADVLQGALTARDPQVLIRQPFAGRVVRTGHALRHAYRIERDGSAIGRIHEPEWFSLRRTMRLDLPADLPVPVQLFLFFLVHALVHS